MLSLRFCIFSLVTYWRSTLFFLMRPAHKCAVPRSLFYPQPGGIYFFVLSFFYCIGFLAPRRRGSLTYGFGLIERQPAALIHYSRSVTWFRSFCLSAISFSLFLTSRSIRSRMSFSFCDFADAEIFAFISTRASATLSTYACLSI